MSDEECALLERDVYRAWLEPEAQELVVAWRRKHDVDGEEPAGNMGDVLSLMMDGIFR